MLLIKICGLCEEKHIIEHMTIVMIIVLLGGRFRLFGENERGLILEETKDGGLQNVRFPYNSPSLKSSFVFS